MLLPDDDLLYPEYLNSVIKVLERNPRVSALVHTAFDVIDIESRVQKHAEQVRSSRTIVEGGGARPRLSRTKHDSDSSLPIEHDL